MDPPPDARSGPPPPPSAAAPSTPRLSRRPSTRSATSTTTAAAGRNEGRSWSPWVRMPASLLQASPPSYVIASTATHAATRAAGRRVSLTPSVLDAINGILDEVVLRTILGARSLTHERLRAHGVVPLLRQPPRISDHIDSTAKASFAREVLTDAEVALKTHEAHLRSTRGFAPLGLAAASRWDGHEAFPVAGSYDALRQQAWYYCPLARSHKGHSKSPSDPPPPPRDTRIPVFPSSTGTTFPTTPTASTLASQSSSIAPPPVAGREQSSFVHLTPQTSVFVAAVLAGLAKAIIAAIGECVSERTVLRSDLDPIFFGNSSGSDSDSVASLEANLESEQAGLIDLATALSNLGSSTNPVFLALDRARKVMGLGPLSLDEYNCSDASLNLTRSGKASSTDTARSSPSIYSNISGRPRTNLARADSVASRSASLTSTLDDREFPAPLAKQDSEPIPPSPAPPSSFVFPPNPKEARRRKSSGSEDSSGVQRSAGIGKLLGLRPHTRRSSGDSADSVSIFHHLSGLRSSSALSSRPEPTSAPSRDSRSRSGRARSASSASLTLRSHSRESTRDWQDPAHVLDAPEFDALLATPTVHVSLTPASLKRGLNPNSLASPQPRASSPQPSPGGSSRSRSHAPPPSSYSFRSGEEPPAPTRRHVRNVDASGVRKGRPDGLLSPSIGTRAVPPGTASAAGERSPKVPGVSGLELQTQLSPAISPVQLAQEENQNLNQVGIALSAPEPSSERVNLTPASTEAQESAGVTQTVTDVPKQDADSDDKPQTQTASSLSRRTSLAEARLQQSKATDAPTKVVPWGYRGQQARNRQRRYSLNDVSTSEAASRRPVGLGSQKFPPVSNLHGPQGRASTESINATSTPITSPATASPQAAPSLAKEDPPTEHSASSADQNRSPSVLSVAGGVRSSLPASQMQQQLQLQHTLAVLEELFAELASPQADARQLVEDKIGSIRGELQSLQANASSVQAASTTSQSAPTDMGSTPVSGQFRKLSLTPSSTSPGGRVPQNGRRRASLALNVARPALPSSTATFTALAGGPDPATPVSSGLPRGPNPPAADSNRTSTSRPASSYRRASADRGAPTSPTNGFLRFMGSPDPAKPDLISSSPDPKQMSLSPMSYAPSSAPAAPPPPSPSSRQNSRTSYQTYGGNNRLSVWSGTSASGRTSPSLSSLAEDRDAAPSGSTIPPRPASAASGYNVVRVPQAALKAQIERDRAVQSRVFASLFGAEQPPTQAPMELGDKTRSRLSTFSAQSVPVTRTRTNTSPTFPPQASTSTRPRSKTGTEAMQTRAIGSGILGGGGKAPSSLGTHSTLHHNSSPAFKGKTSPTVFERAARVFGGPSKQ